MEIIDNRRSIRKYKDTPVSDELIQKLIRSAHLAPSGHNTQPWHFIIVNDNNIKEEISKVSHNQKWMLTAPFFMVCIADIRSRIKDSEDLYIDEESSMFELKKTIRDTAISIQHMVLEAEDNGLGTCWVAWYKQSELRPVLGIPNDKFVVGIITVGYPDENPNPRPRKNIDDIVHLNKW